ncbi:MAG: DsbA family protein [Eubacteriales bacterium]|nr:DsbA family protein [Eubacteriales bacterium]
MLHITFITDFVCPYCLVAREALHQAMAETGIAAEITTLPFELTKEPAPRVDTCHDEKRKARWHVLDEPCRELGLPMKLPPMVCPRPYTRLAFEAWLHAGTLGLDDEWSERMYRAYFLEEKDIGDIAVLAAEAEALGLDAAELTHKLQTGFYTKTMQEMENTVLRVFHPEHVPTMFINSVETPIRHYTREEMATLLRRAAEE